MRRTTTYTAIGALMLMLCVCCSPYRATSSKEFPFSRPTTPLDRSMFINYIDTAAVDDWEGLWLLVGPDIHYMLAIERMNDMGVRAMYSHRIRLWVPVTYNGQTVYEQGDVIGLLSEGLYEETKNMILGQGFITWNKRYRGMIQLDKSRKHIIIDAGYNNEGDIGLRRIYPIRSKEERDYKVRYL